MPGPAACSGSTTTRTTRTSASAAAPTTAVWPSTATRSSWAPSTRTWWHSTPRTARCCGTSTVGRRSTGLLGHARAARHQGHGRHRRGRGRVRHPRLHRGLRRAHRQAGLEVRNHSTARAARQRDLEGRRVGTRRRLGLGDGLVRSGVEPDLLGRRQPRARLEPGPASRRQPLHRVGGGARRDHGRVEVALPVHAERPLRLRRGAGARARGHALARHRRRS